MTKGATSLRCVWRQQLADTITPVSIYLRLRDQFPQSFLLESTDNQPNEKSFSYVCCDPIATFKVHREEIHTWRPGLPRSCEAITSRDQVTNALKAFVDAFAVAYESEEDTSRGPAVYRGEGLGNGLFGYIAYDAIRYFEEIDIQAVPEGGDGRDIPDILYHAFRYILVIDHYRNRLVILENQPVGVEDASPSRISLETLSYLINNKDFPTYHFERDGEQTSNFEDSEYIEVVERCKQHVFRGDVFQVVPSRRFTQAFRGDEFNVYRALRSINPSPYLFYFDCGSFKIFGSSPEAQVVVKDDEARLFPIAGTYRRTGDDAADDAAVARLIEDPKENAEHVMLVDLARNDLSKHCHDVQVENYKEIQRYSHVIHLTSQVCGRLTEGASAIDLLADTFPMGTLSGAPKYRAMQIIDAQERGRRRAYGGAIGVLGFDGTCNHAIVIRSFLSQGNRLFWQAGGGVVADSNPEDERQEVINKLGALQAALTMAEEL